MRKKGQGLSINTIIIAAIALIVLVVLIAIFTGRLGVFSKGLGEVTSCSQLCIAKGYSDGAPDGTVGFDEGSADKPIGARDGEGRQCYCKPKK